MSPGHRGGARSAARAALLLLVLLGAGLALAKLSELSGSLKDPPENVAASRPPGFSVGLCGGVSVGLISEPPSSDM